LKKWTDSRTVQLRGNVHDRDYTHAGH